MLTVFGFARVVFGVRIEGSFAGFLGVCVAFAMMTATFGLLVAVLGKTPEATRGHRDSGDADSGDAGRKLGTGLHLPAMAAEGQFRGTDALGGRRLGCDGLARLRIRCGLRSDRRTARLRGSLRRDCCVALPLGSRSVKYYSTQRRETQRKRREELGLMSSLRFLCALGASALSTQPRFIKSTPSFRWT